MRMKRQSDLELPNMDGMDDGTIDYAASMKNHVNGNSDLWEGHLWTTGTGTRELRRKKFSRERTNLLKAAEPVMFP